MSVFSLKIDIADNKFFNGETSPLFSQSQAKLARQFHQKIAGYRPTPLCALDDLANLFGVKKILVKDESKRSERLQNARRCIRHRSIIVRKISS